MRISRGLLVFCAVVVGFAAVTKLKFQQQDGGKLTFAGPAVGLGDGHCAATVKLVTGLKGLLDPNDPSRCIVENGKLTITLTVKDSPADEPFKITFTVPNNTKAPPTFSGEGTYKPPVPPVNPDPKPPEPGPTQRPAPNPGFWASLFEQLTGWTLLFVSLFTAAVGLGAWLIVSEIRSRRRPGDFDPPPPSQQPDPAVYPPTRQIEEAPSVLNHRIGTLVNDSWSKADAARTTAERALSAAEDAKPYTDQVARSLRREFEEAIAMRLASWGTGEDLETLSRAFRAQRPTPTGRIGNGNPDEQRLVACVNEWLRNGGGDRKYLLQLASELKLSVHFYAHKDLTRVLNDLTKFAYPFELSESDGGWLWAAVPGSNEQLAVPADVAFFQIGRAPDLLDRLFEGMKAARSGFRFQKFYRPCRLRPSPGDPGMYELVNQGRLLLAGADNPDWPQPPDFQALSRSLAGRTFSGPTIARGLADLLSDVSSRLRTAEDGLAAIREDVKQVKVAGPPRISQPAPAAAKILDRALIEKIDQIDRLKDQNERLKKDYGTLIERIGNLEHDLLEVMDAQSQIRAQPPAGAPGAEPVKRSLEDLLAKIDRRQAMPAVSVQQPQTIIRPPQEVMPTVPDPFAKDPVSNAAENVGASLSIPEAPSTSAAPSPAGAALVPRAASREPRLPEGWRDAVNCSAGPDDDQATEGAFVERLRRLARELARLDPSLTVQLVHLATRDEDFEVHNTAGSTAQQPHCVRCRAPQSWQLAVCVGRTGDAELMVLYPPGAMSQFNYPAGYKGLIDDLRSNNFRISTVQSPARLQLARTGDGSVYSVSQKLRWTE
jgi:hypothetical protein